MDVKKGRDSGIKRKKTSGKARFENPIVDPPRAIMALRTLLLLKLKKKEFVRARTSLYRGSTVIYIYTFI